MLLILYFSPFQVRALPACQPEEVMLRDCPQQVACTIETRLSVDVSKAGLGDLNVTVQVTVYTIIEVD